MIFKLCNKIAAYADISDEQTEILQYVLQCFTEKTIVFMTVLLYGYIRKCIVQAVIFYFLCTIIRKHSGGFHMNTFFKCYVTSILLVIVSVEINRILYTRGDGLSIFIINIVSAILIMMIGCVNNSEMDMTYEECQYNKAETRRIMIVIEFMVIAGIFFKVKKMYIILCCQAVICCAFFLILAKIIGQQVNMKQGEQ